MLYCIELTVPPNTPKNEAVTKRITIEKPVIKRVSIYFPPGVACLTKVAIFFGEQQIFPSTQGEWVTGHAESIVDEPNIVIQDVPNQIIIKGYNLDTQYSHTIYIRISTDDIYSVYWYRTLYELVYSLRDFVSFMSMGVL